ncbi:hypothetical protein GGS24DRAFT_507892 [Hypoxylon argillaceum]|nr:hypothetical protein GGS24DRAFT_507892 [Hypoxylon argillaceum]
MFSVQDHIPYWNILFYGSVAQANYGAVLIFTVAKQGNSSLQAGTVGTRPPSNFYNMYYGLAKRIQGSDGVDRRLRAIDQIILAGLHEDQR